MNCDWFITTPLMVMYSGRYLFPSRNVFTSMAVLVICCMVKNSSRIGILEVDHGRTVINKGRMLSEDL